MDYPRESEGIRLPDLFNVALVFYALFVLALDTMTRMGDLLDLRKQHRTRENLWIADPKNPAEVLLSEREAARRCHVTVRTLYRWREEEGLEWVSVGNRVYYRPSALERFAIANTMRREPVSAA